MKILYIYRKYGCLTNGASQVMSRNLRAIKNIVGDNNIIEYVLPQITYRNVISSIISLGSYGVPKKNEVEILEIISKLNPDWIFIESSSYGSIYKRIRKHGSKTICFAHNVDTDLCRAELSSRNPFISLPKYILTKINEKRTAKNTDYLICLTKRDSEGFRRLFNRKADIILPITFPKHKDNQATAQLNNQEFLIFVGSDFFPNIEGLEWFITNVAPHVKYNFRIIGSCCNNIKLKNLKLPNNVDLVGFVEDIAQEYINAKGVIAPIFKGSGMKTKTVEALSFGKSIFGTSEAFAGIDADYNRIGALCNSADEFIEALRNKIIATNNKYSKEIFEQQYSDDVFISQLAGLLEQKND